MRSNESLGNLFIPKNLNRSAKTAAIVAGHPMGAKSAKFESVCHEAG